MPTDTYPTSKELGDAVVAYIKAGDVLLDRLRPYSEQGAMMGGDVVAVQLCMNAINTAGNAAALTVDDVFFPY